MKLTRIFTDRRKADRRETAAQPESLPAAHHEEEEISLVDVMVILVRRRVVFLTACIAAVALGIAAAMIKPVHYAYTTTIQIAKGSSGLIESPATVLAKLNESYIPFALHEARQQTPGLQIRISAKVPKDSQIISLQSIGGPDERDRHAELHRAVVDQLIRDHDRELGALRLDLQSESSRIRSQLESLKAQSLLFKDRAKRLDEQEAVIQAQLADVRRHIDQNQAMRRKLLQEDGTNGGTSSVMLLDGELARLGQRESELNEQLLVSINSQRDDLKSKELDNTRQQMDLQENLEELGTKLAAIVPTGPITPTLRSLDPVGISAKAIVALAVAGGIVIGLFAAFFAEFVARTRARLRAEPAS